MGLAEDAAVPGLAQWYLSRVRTGRRGSGAEYIYFASCACESLDCEHLDLEVTRAEEERCRALAFAAHCAGDVLPDDHRYEFIREALALISEEADDLDDLEPEADVYTSDLMAWLASRSSRQGYCDEAVREGLCDGSQVSQTLACGQYLEKREVLAAVLQHLRDEAELEEEAVAVG